MTGEASGGAADGASIGLRRWTRDDGVLLARLLGGPRMTEHLGGPETPEQLRDRLERYVTLDPETAEAFVITVGLDAEPVGFVGYWESDLHGVPVWEAGWSVVPERQGRGLASAAVARVVELATARRRFRQIVAFPGVDNAASNAVCRKAGLRRLGEQDIEYPKGHPMRVNVWALDLW